MRTTVSTPASLGSASGRVAFAGRMALTVVTLAGYAVLAPWGYGLFAILVLLPTRRPTRRRARLQAAIRTGFRSMHAWLRRIGLVDIRRPEVDPGRVPRPCVVIANHPTHFDITAILGWLPDCCTMVKPSIYRRWWLRPLMEGSGQIEGAGSHPLDGVRLVERAVSRVREGQRIVIFPEGTRTETGREMPFHRLAFEIASRAGVPVVPLRVSCDPPYLSKSRPVLRPPRITPVLTVEVLESLHPADEGWNSRRLRERARSLYTQSGERGLE